MNPEILEQKNNDERRTFVINSNGLQIIEKSNLGEIRRHILFENITNDVVKFNFNPVFWIILIVLVILLFVSGLFVKLFGVEGVGQIYRYAITFLVGGLVTLFFMASKEIRIKCLYESDIELFKNNPDEGKVDEFIKLLFKTRNKVLRKKYCFVSEYMSYKDQIEKFTLLHSLNIINLNEFEELKMQLDNLTNNKSDDEININWN